MFKEAAVVIALALGLILGGGGAFGFIFQGRPVLALLSLVLAGVCWFALNTIAKYRSR